MSFSGWMLSDASLQAHNASHPFLPRDNPQDMRNSRFLLYVAVFSGSSNSSLVKYVSQILFCPILNLQIINSSKFFYIVCHNSQSKYAAETQQCWAVSWQRFFKRTSHRTYTQACRHLKSSRNCDYHFVSHSKTNGDYQWPVVSFFFWNYTLSNEVLLLWWSFLFCDFFSCCRLL